MPTVDENLTAWNQDYAWSEEGDEWSGSWGGVKAQWYGTILPRLQHFLPAQTILEIAPGMGRWTQFLVGQTSRLIGVDISDRCTEACRSRFAGVNHAEFHTNDGTSLAMVPDHSVDLAFSFDSLVHAEAPVIQAYLHELRCKLAEHGVAFLHHSNLGAYRRYHAGVTRSYKVRKVLERLPFVFTDFHWRAPSMSAALFRQQAAEAGLHCVCQEIVNWGTSSRRFLIDCLSVVSPSPPREAAQTRVFANPDFIATRNYWRDVFRLYHGRS